MTIYLDVVFLENLFMNYIILFATAVINKTHIKIIRLAISSGIGSLYAVLCITQILSNTIGIVIKLMLSIAMVYIALKPTSLKKLIKEIIIFYLTSFTFGGVAFFLLYFVKPGEILMKNGIFIGTYPLKIALLGGTVGFIIITIAFKIVKNKISKSDMFCQIEVQIKDKNLKTIGMLDTGNLLKEPITGIPVVIIEKGEVEKILPGEIIENIDEIINGRYRGSTYIEEYIPRFRIIPFHSIGKQNGMLLGIKPDYVKVNQGEKEIVQKNVVLGIYENNLSKNNQYHVLIGLDMLEEIGGKQNEYFGNVKI